MIVLPSMPCQNSSITYQIVAQITGAPMWVCDIPYNMDEEGAMEYWVKQYKGIIPFLEEHSKKKMDYDRLKAVVEESNRLTEYWLEFLELQKLKPAPWTGTFGIGVRAALFSFGNPMSTAAVKYALDKVKDRVVNGKVPASEEKVRVIWFHFPVFWDTKLISWMKEMGAVVPFVLNDDYRPEPIDTSNVETMIRGMARRTLMAPMGSLGRGAFDAFIEELLYVVAEWKGDCVIIAAHPGCKWLTGGYGLIRDECRERGIPVMLFDLDLVDPRVTSPEESRSRIEQFLNMVMTR